jgi:hypothetical protein
MPSSVILFCVLLLLVTANVVPSKPDSCHPEDGDDTFLQKVGYHEATRRDIPEDDILQDGHVAQIVTLSVRSAFAFLIKDMKERMTAGQEERKRGRQEDKRTGGQEVRRTRGQEDRRTGGEEERKTGGEENRKTRRHTSILICSRRNNYGLCSLRNPKYY